MPGQVGGGWLTGCRPWRCGAGANFGTARGPILLIAQDKVEWDAGGILSVDAIFGFSFLVMRSQR